MAQDVLDVVEYFPSFDNPMPTLNLATSKKIAELLPDLVTENIWDSHNDLTSRQEAGEEAESYGVEFREATEKQWVSAPSFSEVIRALPAIWKIKNWRWRGEGYEPNGVYNDGVEASEDIMGLYRDAPTPEAGMEQVSEYLNSLLTPIEGE